MKIKITPEQYSKKREKYEREFGEASVIFKSLVKSKLETSYASEVMSLVDVDKHREAYLIWKKYELECSLKLTNDEQEIVEDWYSFFAK